MGATTKLDRLASRQDGVFNRQQALANGVSQKQIRQRLDDGTWTALDANVYASSAAPVSWPRQLRAVYLSRPDVRVAGRSAALLHGFPGIRTSRPEILVPFAGNARSPLARVIRSRHYELISEKTINSMVTTSIAETLFTLGFTNPPPSIERWIDNLIASNRLTAADFDPIFARLTSARVRGLRALRGIVASRDHDSYQPPTSELERLLYQLLDRAELPAYARQLPIHFEQAAATVDAFVEEWRLIIEGDGRRWHTRTADFERDRKRDNAAAAAGVQVIRFTYRMLKSDPDGCVETLINTGRWR